MNTVLTMLFAAILSSVSGRVLENNADSAGLTPLPFATVALITSDNNEIGRAHV